MIFTLLKLYLEENVFSLFTRILICLLNQNDFSVPFFIISENQYHGELVLARELVVALDLENFNLVILETFNLTLQCIHLLRWESYFLVNKDVLIFYMANLISLMHSNLSGNSLVSQDWWVLFF